MATLPFRQSTGTDIWVVEVYPWRILAKSVPFYSCCVMATQHYDISNNWQDRLWNWSIEVIHDDLCIDPRIRATVIPSPFPVTTRPTIDLDI